MHPPGASFLAHIFQNELNSRGICPKWVRRRKARENPSSNQLCVRLVQICVALLVVAINASARAVIFDSDDRVQIHRELGSVYAPIGIAFGTGRTRYATATLVGPCYALTSQHIFGTQKSPLGKRLWFAEAMNSSDALRSAGTVVAAGGMERFSRPGQEYDARSRDWILVQLDKCLGAILGSAKLSIPKSESDIAHVQNAGFPVDRRMEKGLTIDPTCTIQSIWKLVWLHDCATRSGNSGGPIFRISQTSSKPHLEVYAIEAGGWRIRGVQTFSTQLANQATPAAEIIPFVSQFLTN